MFLRNRKEIQHLAWHTEWACDCRKLPNCAHLCPDICHPNACPTATNCRKKVWQEASLFTQILYMLLIFLFWACCTIRVNTQHCHLLGHLWVYDRLWYDVHASDWRKSGCVVRFKLHKKERPAQKIFLKGLSHLDMAFCFVIRIVCDWLLNRRRRRSLRHSGSANSKNLRSWFPLCISNNFFYTFWMRPLDIWI